jgi:hypothetical protein
VQSNNHVNLDHQENVEQEEKMGKHAGTQHECIHGDNSLCRTLADTHLREVKAVQAAAKNTYLSIF